MAIDLRRESNEHDVGLCQQPHRSVIDARAEEVLDRCSDRSS